MTTRPPHDVALASVALGNGQATVSEFPLGDCGPDSGWLRVEASGICGTDVGLYTDPLPHPYVLGHHVLGQVAALGETAAARWGLTVGDWVVLEEYLPCGDCAMCRGDRYRLCPQTDLWRGGRRVGMVSASEPPGLWGGNAQYLHLPPNAVPHTLPAGLSPELAVWALPLGNVLDWLLGAGRLRTRDTVVVIGPGYHGIAAAAVGSQVGARQVIVCGLERDRPRLALAEALGATTVTIPHPELPTVVAELTGGRMADVVLDLAGSLGEAVSLLAQGGRVVVAGGTSAGPAALDTSALTRLTASVVGVRGRAPARVRQAIDLLHAGGLGLEQVPTEVVDLAGTGAMLGRLANGEGPDTPHVVVRPWAPSTGKDAGE